MSKSNEPKITFSQHTPLDNLANVVFLHVFGLDGACDAIHCSIIHFDTVHGSATIRIELTDECGGISRSSVSIPLVSNKIYQ